MLGGCIDVSNQRIREFEGLITFEQDENGHPKRCSVPSYHTNDDIKGSADIGDQKFVVGLEIDILKALSLVDLFIIYSWSVRHKFVRYVQPVELAQVQPN